MSHGTSIQTERATLSADIKAQALQCGFDLVGICPAVAPAGIEHFRAWLRQGFAGQMTYMHRHAAAREHPDNVLAGARSIVMLAVNYRTADPPEPGPLQGKVSRYAWGTDYHRLLRERLDRLAKFLRRRCPGCAVRGVVDTAPLLERDFAQLAGLGWIGKNTMLLNKKAGSWLFLAALLVDVELDYDQAHRADHCGTCTRCLEACPTEAFAGPYQLDSRRCISYLTIELRGGIPEALRPAIGSWVFGCDICQEVCPWNRKAPRAEEIGFEPRGESYPVDLMSLLETDPADFRTRYRDTAMERPRRRGLLRNAAIALGNSGRPEAVPALCRALEDSEPLVRGAAAWALGRLGTPDATAAVERRLEVETDREVRGELTAAMHSLGADEGTPPLDG